MIAMQGGTFLTRTASEVESFSAKMRGVILQKYVVLVLDMRPHMIGVKSLFLYSCAKESSVNLSIYPISNASEKPYNPWTIFSYIFCSTVNNIYTHNYI